MRGELSSGRHANKHPLDWYVDEGWCARQLAVALGGFKRERAQGLAVWDPSCGLGNTLQAAWELGIPTYGSDLVDNFAWANFDACPDYPRPVWFSADFLERTVAPADCSIVCNPPYSYLKVCKVPIAELFVRRALELASGRVCALLPVKWLSSQGRFRLFMDEHPPRAVLVLCQRPSMPPGDMIGALGSRAFRGAKVDYAWFIWDVQQPTAPGTTTAAWLPPLHIPGRAIEGLA